MRILFFDLDGCLNSRAYFEAQEAKGVFQTDDMIDPAAVARFNRVIQETQAKVVVSSTVRLDCPFAALLNKFSRSGIEADFIGVTPRITRTADGSLAERGHEILSYLESLDSPPEGIAIMDDSDDMVGLTRYLVRLDCSVGLLDHDVDRLIRMLRSPYRDL